MNATFDNLWIISDKYSKHFFFSKKERSVFVIIGSGSWYIEGGEKFEGLGEKKGRWLSQGGRTTSTSQLYLVSIKQPSNCSLFNHKKCKNWNILFFWWKYIFGILEKLEVVEEVLGGRRRLIERRPRRQYITTVLGEHYNWENHQIRLQKIVIYFSGGNWYFRSEKRLRRCRLVWRRRVIAGWPRLQYITTSPHTHGEH